MLYANIQTVGHPTGEIRGQFIGMATDASETVQGTFNDDMLVGLGGDDILKGSDGNDILIGGAGNNTYDGGDDEIGAHSRTGPTIATTRSVSTSISPPAPAPTALAVPIISMCSIMAATP